LHHRHRLGFRLTQLNWELPDEMLANWLVALQLYRVFGSWGSRGHWPAGFALRARHAGAPIQARTTSVVV
jgi:hypothetical protein